MCDRCSEFDNKTKSGDPITDQQKDEHDAHLVQAKKMSSLMHYAENACRGPSHTDEDQDGCNDSVAYICTDMMQIQTIPILKEQAAYFKTKVNEIIIPL